MAGCDDDPVFSAALSKLKGTWNHQDGGFHLRQEKFVDQLELISLSQRRSRADTDNVTLGELTHLRGVSGSANWLGNQTRPDLFSNVHMHQQRRLTHVKQTNSFVCVDSMHTCLSESLRFLWTI